MPASVPQSLQTLPYILKNREYVISHIERHKQSWDPAASKPAENEADEIASSVSVHVRVRPLLTHDLDQGSFSLAAVQQPRTIHFTHPTLRWAGSRFATKTYQADAVFSETDDSETVYQKTGLLKSLRKCIEASGKELYVLAYGQTGTGKTYTTTYLEESIITDLFSQIGSTTELVSVHTSIFELRGTAAYDLLSSPPFSPVKITTASSHNSLYPGLSEHTASNAEDLLGLLKQAASLRFTRSTTKNDTSSRSHSIVRFRLVFHKTATSTLFDDTAEPPPSSNIFVVDLAGSERAAHVTQNDDPDRRKEAIETNKSLAALKDCIRSRLENDSSSSASAAVWRGSKLTTVLRRAFERDSSASGDVRVTVIACISPSVLDCEDSLNTLNYVTPFRLSGREAFESANRQKEVDFASMYLADAAKWDHERSVAYINRNLPKFAPFTDRLLPTSDSTIFTLFSLTQDELTTLLSKPPQGEASADAQSSPKSSSIAQIKLLGQAKSFAPSYYTKLQKLSSDIANEAKKQSQVGTMTTKPMGSTKQASLRGQGSAAASLKALSGRNFAANETGPITKLAYHDSIL